MGPAVTSLDVIGWSPLHVGGDNLILRSEGITEVSVQQSVILVMVIAADEKVHIIFVWETAKFIKSLCEFGSCDPSLAVFVKHLEGVHQIKVVL